MTPPGTTTERPLMIWCSSHSTLYQEEIPLFIEAGFRVIPLLVWTDKTDKNLASKTEPQWQHSVDLPFEIIQKLQRLTLYADSGQSPFRQEDIDLLNKYVDVIYVTVFPNLAIRLTKVFNGVVIFRPFGHGALNNYSNISHLHGTSPKELVGYNNYFWVPILTTLQEIETPQICMNATHLGAYVTEKRLGKYRWNSAISEPYVVETIPRICEQTYYLDVYNQYRRDHGHLPIKILGGNKPCGGYLNDKSIVGFLDDDAYFLTAARARISIYHGRSRYHIHYHPIEFMAMGVPVLFHQESAFSSEAQHFGFTTSELYNYGMFQTTDQANTMAEMALRDSSLAEEWSQKQRLIIDRVFSRGLALNQARWLRTRAWQHKLQSTLNTNNTTNHPTDKRSFRSRILKHLVKVWK